jgi:hypothetical protein
MKIFYRLSDGSYKKNRLEYATKENCLKNFLKEFHYDDDMVFLILDNVRDETYEQISALADSYISFRGRPDHRWHVAIERTSAGSSAASFKLVLDKALHLDREQTVYFVEDDYAHLPGSRCALQEGLERAHYVTLYNHPDKYIPAARGGNPHIGEDAAEETKVFVTDSCYWMMTNSTTMTFATKVETLDEDELIWQKYIQGNYPEDMRIFFELRTKGRGLIQPIPTFATHCEIPWTAHLHGTGVKDWNKVLEEN